MPDNATTAELIMYLFVAAAAIVIVGWALADAWRGGRRKRTLFLRLVPAFLLLNGAVALMSVKYLEEPARSVVAGVMALLAIMIGVSVGKLLRAH